MRRVRFHRSETLSEALELRADFREAGTVVAGATDLLVALRMQSGSLPPLEVIDLGPIASLRGITQSAESVRIGALATHDEIERSELIRRSAPLLAEACGTVGSPQIRHRGTIGGNVANAASCADSMPPLVALGARFLLESHGGRREVPAAEFVQAPYRTMLGPDEVLTAISFAMLGGNERSAFVKLGRRNALSVSRLSVAVILRTGEDGRVAAARIAAGSILPTVRRFEEAEDCLVGTHVDEAARAAAAAALSAAMVAQGGRRWSTPYKEPVVQALVQRVIRAAWEGGS